MKGCDLTEYCPWLPFVWMCEVWRMFCVCLTFVWCLSVCNAKERSSFSFTVWDGRAVTFDDLEEHTGISEETHRRFFHIYVEFGSTSFFQKYVQLPSDNDIESSSKEYFVAGLPGKFVLNMVLY